MTDIDAFTKEIMSQAERIAELEAHNAVLAGALKPFADSANDCLDETDLDRWDAWEHSVAMNVTIGDFRRAAEALNATPDRIKAAADVLRMACHRGDWDDFDEAVRRYREAKE